MPNDHGLSDKQMAELVKAIGQEVRGGCESATCVYPFGESCLCGKIALAAYAVCERIAMRKAAGGAQGIIDRIQTYPQITEEQVSQAFTAGVIRAAILSLIPKGQSHE